ncbi:MAG: UDP-N-acetylmuramoyl-tripeptide--D-alanyl-D-alanine ligase [Ruminococcaceae bacterium]|nr:UDP-N-acetylmuramoyl-tripeptide--D-alanyl-D-alanine ligase [Oscillospiraceae bacterium]
MKPISIQDIILATGGALLSGDPSQTVISVCTDTRKIVPGSLFVPLAGENFDAHKFIPDALTGGCAASLTARKDITAEKPLIYVPDTRRALADLAAYYRKQFAIPVVAITGSVGKTTAKELTSAVLSTKLNVLKTAGNFNNEIGLPLTLFRLEDDHEVAITEMGMSGFGEIDLLAKIAKPDIGIVTNIGMSHIEMLGSQENIYKAKSELFRHISPDGTVILNGDDPILAAHRKEITQKTITVGLSAGCDLTATDIVPKSDSLSFTAVYGDEKVPVNLAFPGEHNVINALLACAAGLCLGISLADAAFGLGAYIPSDRRMQLIDCDGITIINDCYNAAPASMEAGIRVLCSYEGRKIAVLGDIKELGEFSKEAHTGVGTFAGHAGVDALFTLGDHAKWIAEGAKNAGMAEESIFSFDDIDELKKSLGAFIKKGDTVLIKASRAMALERVTEFLTTGQNA